MINEYNFKRYCHELKYNINRIAGAWSYEYFYNWGEKRRLNNETIKKIVEQLEAENIIIYNYEDGKYYTQK